MLSIGCDTAIFACYAVRYPRFCKGGRVVCPVKEKPSYGGQFQSVLKY